MIQENVLNLISEISGHEVSDLSLELELEAEVGLDSIKTVGLFTKLPDCLPVGYQESFKNSVDQQSLISLRTISEIVDFLEKFMCGEGKSENVNSKVLHSQLIFLVAHWAVSTCSLCSKVRIQGPLNQELLNRSWSLLVQRHPCLRGCFTCLDESETTLGDYMFSIKESIPDLKVEVKDFSSFTSEELNNKLLAVIAEKTSYSWEINEGFLHGFEAYKISENEFEIFFYNHHLISDGLSNQLVLKEFVYIYDHFLSNQQPHFNSTYSTEDYIQAVKQLNSWYDQKETDQLKTYIKEQGRKGFLWNPELNPMTSGNVRHRNRLFKLNKKDTSRLIEEAGKARVSMNSLVASAYLKTISECSPELSEVILNVPTSGRIYPDINLFDMVGCFAQNLALSFKMPDGHESFQDYVYKVQETIQSCLAAGMDRAQTLDIAQMLQKLPIQNKRTPKSVDSVVQASVKSNVFLSFIGQSDFQECQKLSLMEYHPATTTAANTLDTLVEFYRGEMLLAVNADQDFYSESFIQSFGKKLISNLERITLQEINSDKMVIVDDSSKMKLLKIAESVLNRTFSEEDFSRDLESELGMDSLLKIRIVSKISQLFKKLSPNKLIETRSLAEMAALIDTLEKVDMPFTIINEQCSKTPDSIAVFHNGNELSYRKLDSQSNKLARLLKTQGVTRNSLVAIMSPRSPEMLIGVMAILKAGGAYVPIDPTYPTDRIQYILNHSNVTDLMLNATSFNQIESVLERESSLERVICLKPIPSENFKLVKTVPFDEWQSILDQKNDLINEAHDLMCVLYTSGSTGNPKGVTLTHQGYTNRLAWMQKTFPLSPGDRVAHKTSCCFDISVWEIFWPLMYGATVCPLDDKVVKNPWALAEWLNEEKINVMHFVPSLFGEFLNIIENEDYEFKNLRWLIFSGEILPVNFVQRWVDRFGMKTGLANLYGPTEASIDVTCHIIKERPYDGQLRIPIGKPVDNTEILILDKDMNRLPQGSVGELWIAGIQLATGYLNDPEKTEKSFVKNPFDDVKSSFLYRSGDLAAKLSDGNFDYHGRIDNQVKIRGFRVELGEIEAVLNKHKAVKNCAVIILEGEDRNLRLVACVSSHDEDLGDQLRQYCQEKLPKYMVPHVFNFFKNLPKTANGKLDRKTLKELVQKSNSFERHSNNIEKIIKAGPAQKWMFNYFKKPYSWHGTSRFMFKELFDQIVFEKSVDILIQRHESLRTSFSNNGEWQQIIHQSPGSNELSFFDCRALSVSERNSLIEKKISKACQEFNPEKLPLFKVYVFEIENKLREIAVVAHHLICDMLSSSTLFAELWSIYGSLKNNSHPENHKVVNYSDFVKDLPTTREDLKKLSSFWKKHIAKYGSLKFPNCQNNGPNDEKSGSSITLTLGQDATSYLLSDSKKDFKATVYHTLLAPLYKLMSMKTSQSSVLISHRSHGRQTGHHRDFINAVGNFACNFPLGIRVDGQDTPCEIVKKIEEAFESLPLKGISYDWSSDDLGEDFYPDNSLTPIRVNYLGQRDLPKSNLFEFDADNYDIRYASPEQRRTCDIEFIFFITNRNLNLRIEYSRNLHSQERILELGESYFEMLKLFLEKPYQAPVIEQKQLEVQLKKSKTVLVTESDKPFGRQLAIKLAKRGHQVFVIGKNTHLLSELDKSHDKISSLGHVCLKSVDEINECIGQIQKSGCSLDAWVNAKILQGKVSIDSSPELWQTMIDDKLLEVFNSSHILCEYFGSRGRGDIVNITSELAYECQAGYAPLSAVEHAVRAFTMSMAAELTDENVRVNCVCPKLHSSHEKLQQDLERTQDLVISLLNIDQKTKRLSQPSDGTPVLFGLAEN